MTGNPVLVAVPIGLAVLVLGIYGWRREMFNRKKRAEDRRLLELARSARLPEGSVDVRTLGAPEYRADRSGRIMLVLDGSFSENVGVGLLRLLAQCGMDGTIGSVLVLEADGRRRERFLQDVPQVFADRVVVPEFPGIGGGFGNASPAEVMAKIDRWGPTVIKGTTEACDRHQRLHRGDEAALVLVFVSQGGQAMLGTEAVKTIAHTFKMARCFGFTALPVDDRLRVRVAPVLEAYREVGVHGFVCSDNLQDEVRNDFGMVAAIAGFASASEGADAAVEQNNAWYLLFTETPGGLVSYSTYIRSLPGYRLTPTHPAVRPRYYIFRNPLISTAITGLDEVHRPEYDAVGGAGRNGQEPLTSRFDIVLTAVAPDDLKSDEDDVVLGQYLKGRDKRNYHLLFASMATEVNPTRPLCPLVVVSLHAVHDAPHTLAQLTTPPRLPDTGRNGHHPVNTASQEVEA